MAKKRRSFGQKKASANKKIFVGRKEQIQQFEDNLKIGTDSDDFLNIFNVFGQGGVGKTTLAEHYQNMASISGYLTARIDTEDIRLYEVTATMNAIAEIFTNEGFSFKRFSKRYKVYLQEKGKLETNPDRPKGTLGRLVKAGVKTGAKIGADLAPGGNTFSEYLPIDDLADTAGEWADWVARTLTNKDELELVLHPLRVLTPLWLEDLNQYAEKSDIALFFDTYEAANPELDNWLLDLLEEKYGDLPANILLIISGREVLNPGKWNTYREYSAKIPLSPFSEEEAKAYLAKRGVIQPIAVEAILSISNCLPVYLSLLAENDPANPDDITDPNEKIVERFLKHIKDPLQRKLALQAALPRQLNQDVVACMLPEGADAVAQFRWLTNRPFVQKRGGHWAYHPIVRDTFLRHQKEISETVWEKVHLQLVTFYQQRAERLQVSDERDKWFEDENWRLIKVEQHFHQLLANYKQFLPEIIKDFATVMRINDLEYTNPYIISLTQVEVFSGNALWGSCLKKGVASLLAEKYEEEVILEMYNRINSANWLINNEDRAFFYYWQGFYEKSKKDKLNYYDLAIKEKSDLHRIWYSKGLVLLKEDKNKAKICFSKEAEVNPNFPWVWLNLGIIHLKLNDIENALDCFKKILVLEDVPFKVGIIVGTRLLYKGFKTEALEYFNKVYFSISDNIIDWLNLGIIFKRFKQKEKALKCLEKCLLCNSSSVEVWKDIGLAFFSLKDKERAKKCFEKCLLYSSEVAETWRDLGDAFLRLEKEEKVKKVLEKVGQSNSESVETWIDLGTMFLKLGEEEKARKALEKGLACDSESVGRWTNLGAIFLKLGEEEKARKALEKGLACDSKSVSVWKVLGAIFLKLGEEEKARKALEKGLACDSESMGGWADLGATFLRLGEEENAKKALAEGLACDSESAGGWANLGAIFLRLGEEENAKKALEKGLACDSESVNVWKVLGATFLRLGEEENAKKALEKGLACDSESVKVWIDLGGAFLRLGEEENAKKALEKGLACDSESVSFWKVLGGAFLRLGEEENAKKALEKGLACDSESVSVWKVLGAIFLRLGEEEKAKKALEKGVACDSKSVKAWTDLGSTFLRLGEEENAKKALEKGLACDSESVSVWKVLGSTFLRLGKEENAKKALAKGLECDSENTGHWANLGSTFLRLGEEEKAKKALVKGLACHSDNPVHWANLGNAFNRINDVEKTIECFNKAEKLAKDVNNFPRGKYALIYLAHNYLMSQQQEKAKKWYLGGMKNSKDKDTFYAKLEKDYEKLKMQNYGITPESYQSIINELKKEINQ